MEIKGLLRNRHFLYYLIKFIGVFCIAYYGTIAVIGLSAPGNHYSKIIDHYFNYVGWLRSSLLIASKWVLSIFGFQADLVSKFLIKLNGGHGIRIVYSCIGYGVMSFWVAFIIANTGGLQKKFLWISGGLFLIWLINVCRICLLLLAINKMSPLLEGFDHHTWFNIVSYILIFILMYFFDKSSGVTSKVNGRIQEAI